MKNLKNLKTKIDALENKYNGIVRVDTAYKCIYLYNEENNCYLFECKFFNTKDLYEKLQEVINEYNLSKYEKELEERLKNIKVRKLSMYEKMQELIASYM